MINFIKNKYEEWKYFSPKKTDYEWLNCRKNIFNIEYNNISVLCEKTKLSIEFFNNNLRYPCLDWRSISLQDFSPKLLNNEALNGYYSRNKICLILDNGNYVYQNTVWGSQYLSFIDSLKYHSSTEPAILELIGNIKKTKYIFQIYEISKFSSMNKCNYDIEPRTLYLLDEKSRYLIIKFLNKCLLNIQERKKRDKFEKDKYLKEQNELVSNFFNNKGCDQ